MKRLNLKEANENYEDIVRWCDEIKQHAEDLRFMGTTNEIKVAYQNILIRTRRIEMFATLLARDFQDLSKENLESSKEINKHMLHI